MNIYIGRLARSVNEEQLKALFEPFGEVVSVKIPKDKFSGETRGFAFVQMGTTEEGQAAIAGLNGHEIDRQRISVNEARPKEDRPAYGSKPRFGSNGPRDRDNRSGGSNSGWRMSR